ncbi:MAG: beta-lactamase family protein [Oscillospiraceae bacterium]|nr:beta-lactamase family protein [Oscillospiraceae bacterium]
MDKLEERLLEFIANDSCQALVIKAARYGVPIFEGCYGVSTNEYGVKMDTIFPVFSNTKVITSALIFILLEEGLLEPETRFSKFLPEYAVKGWENIRLWHLMTHTHGIDGEFWTSVENYIKDEFKIAPPEGEWDRGKRNEYDSKIKKALGLPEDYGTDKMWETVSLKVAPKNEPGKVMAYSNYGYDRLKEVICAVTGESIDSYAQKVLFGPLGMVDSHWVLPKEKWDRVLGRNEKCLGHGWINSESCYNNEGGGNGLKTTANDMSAFCEVILCRGRFKGRRILSPASVKQMTSNYNSHLPNPFDAWSLGWNYRGKKVDDAGVLRSENCVEHGGWAGHKVLADPEYGLSIIVFAGEYPEPNDMGGHGNWGKINNMVIAACE